MSKPDSPEQQREKFLEVLVRTYHLAHDANVYLKASQELKEQISAAPIASRRADVQSLLAKAGELHAVAVAAVEYSDAVIAFAKVGDDKQRAETELQRVQVARKQLRELSSGLKLQAK